MKLLIFGKTGQVGSELYRYNWPHYYSIEAVNRVEIGLTDHLAVARCIHSKNPDVVINAAAYTAVDQAESEKELAFKINSEAPGIMARACAETGAALIHISTDYVFDGFNKAPYREGDKPAPFSIYGGSKARGERNVREACDRHLILRTSWIYSVHGSNFLKTVLRLCSERRELRIVSDQTGCPTSATSIAAAIQKMLFAITDMEVAWGTYHFCGSGQVTWHGFAERIVNQASPFLIRKPNIQPVSTEDYPAKARRPAYSVLDCSKIGKKFGIYPESWDKGLVEVINELNMSQGQ